MMRDDPDRSEWNAHVAHGWHYAAAMRTFGLPSLLALAFAGGCTDTGAHLTFSAPQGPSSAQSFRVVLATPETVPTIQNQRIQPASNTTQSVSYFLQRTVAGSADRSIDKVDGFTLRIAPDSDVVDTQFIPFVLIYDANNQIVGVGTYLAGDTPTPSPILVVRDEIDKYTLDVEAAVETTNMDEPGPGQVQIIDCYRDDQSAYTSGIIWRPLGGGELRIMLPDDGGTDATGRALDLDCDGHAVSPESSRPDCDDTRNWFHRDAEDVCDGYDTNCDNQQAIATTCESPDLCFNTTTNAHTGVELCDDQAGRSLGCYPSASCSCQLGQGCISCEMPYAAGSAQGYVKPCQPAIGVLKTYEKCSIESPCTVEVLGTRNGWKVEIASTTSGAFGFRAEGVKDSFAIKAKRPEGSSYEQEGAAGMNLSDVDFAFITAAGTKYVGMQLVLDETSAAADACPASPMITCYP